MKFKKSFLLENVLPLVVIVVLFVLVSFFVGQNEEFLKKIILENNFFGSFVYIFIFVISIVFAPFSALPLMPFGAVIWGPNIAAVYAVIGWTVGAMIAFFIARKFGKPIIKKFINLKKIEKIEKVIPEKNIFFTVLFLRMIIPVDGLSYFLGLFSNIKTSIYFWATFLGIIPFCFIFSYLGVFPLEYQIIGFVLIGVVLAFSYFKKFFR